MGEPSCAGVAARGAGKEGRIPRRESLKIPALANGAGNGIRTRDPQLGKFTEEQSNRPQRVTGIPIHSDSEGPSGADAPPASQRLAAVPTGTNGHGAAIGRAGCVCLRPQGR